MRVLVGCEFSGVVREAMRARGHDAVSCDLLPAEDGSPHHVEGDVRALLGDGWDLAVFHPPCTRLTVAGARWFKGREAEQASAISFAEALWSAPIPRIALENPIGVLSTRSALGKPAQIIQPWQFGHGETWQIDVFAWDGGPYTPHFSTYLNQERWTDENPVVAKAAKAATDDAAYRAMRERVIAEQDARARAMEGR